MHDLIIFTDFWQLEIHLKQLDLVIELVHPLLVLL